MHLVQQSPTLYQLIHPWHWLTYGNNAGGVAAIVAMAGLWGLWKYVVFTKKLMEASLQTNEAAVKQLEIAQRGAELAHKTYLESMTPHLTIRINTKRVPNSKGMFVTIINIGSGRATDIKNEGVFIVGHLEHPAGAEFEAAVGYSENDFTGNYSRSVFLRYSSVDGRRFRTETTIKRGKNEPYEFFVANEMKVDITNGEQATLEGYLAASGE